MKQLKGKYKIALVGEMLSQGGAERVQARLSFYFEAIGIEVHHIIVIDEVTYSYAGQLFNMGKLKSKRNSVFNKLNRLLKFNAYLKKHQFDFIIDFRVKNNFKQEFIIANYLYKSPYIMSIRSFETAYYFPKKLAFAQSIFKKAYGFTTVTKALEEKIKSDFKYSNVKTIYNPLDFDLISNKAEESITFTKPYILGVGRLHDIKQFDHLIKVYSKSEAISKGIDLVILGEGDLLEALKSLTEALHISSQVKFLGFKQNIFPYLKNAYLTALTSKNEGFPNVLIESLATGTPVVAYNCDSGPSEIIKEGVNGLLVKNQCIASMTKGLNKMILSEELYRNCKSNATKSIEHLSLNKIGQEWVDFMKLK